MRDGTCMGKDVSEEVKDFKRRCQDKNILKKLKDNNCTMPEEEREREEEEEETTATLLS